MNPLRANPVFYPLFKITIGTVCLILSVEYAISYIIYNKATFGILYIADCLAWFLASFILMGEGFMEYVQQVNSVQKSNTGDSH